jgi:hypothetical protein
MHLSHGRACRKQDEQSRECVSRDFDDLFFHVVFICFCFKANLKNNPETNPVPGLYNY